MEQIFTYRNQKKLRWGYTTGTCAAAASLAAVLMLLGRKETELVSLTTPKGVRLELEIEDIQMGENWVSCAVCKDGGDDPDVTNGMLVYSHAEYGTGSAEGEPENGYVFEREGVRIELMAGEGVGVVTKPGLNCPVGKPAINPVPRSMIFHQAERACRESGFQGCIKLSVSVPGGKEQAEKTFNPRLGILGGISILGTSGMVEPMSERALLETIGLELRQKRLAGCERLILTPGNYGTAFLRDHLGIELDQAVKCSNFIGDTLDLAVQEKLRQVLLVGHGGKLIKLAAGVMNTHSSAADGRMEVLGAWGGALGASSERICRILEAVTVEQALFILDETPGLLEAVMSRVMERVEFHLKKRAGERLQAECIIFTNERGILGMTSGAEALLKEFETE